jgi:3-deoxy-7-phosphoheptulonate synthase
VHAATRGDFYTSHEGLHLLSEQAQTRYIERQKKWYNLSTHMPWIGMRTAQIGAAHVEYFRGIANPDRCEGRRGHERRMAAGADPCLNPQNQPGG